MHAAEVDAESVRLREFTNERFKMKNESYQQNLKKIEEDASTLLEKVRKECEETDLALKYRLEDFTTQLNGRITKDYVEILGRQIKSGIMDSFDRKNEDTLDKMRNMVNEIGLSQEQLTIDTLAKLAFYRTEIAKFREEFYEKATKKEFHKALESLEAGRTQADMQYDLLKLELRA